MSKSEPERNGGWEADDDSEYLLVPTEPDALSAFLKTLEESGDVEIELAVFELPEMDGRSATSTLSIELRWTDGDDEDDGAEILD